MGRDVIIDPLSIDDISGLGEFFENPSVIKIFHDAGYDLICLYRDFGFKFAGLFDTMLASRLIGRKRFGLASLLQDYLNLLPTSRFNGRTGLGGLSARSSSDTLGTTPFFFTI